MQGRRKGKSRRQGRKKLQREAERATRKHVATWKPRKKDLVVCLEVGVEQGWVVESSDAEDQLLLS